MTEHAPVPFDLARARARAVANSDSRRFWSSLEELIDEDGFRAWLAAEFPAASLMFDDPGRRQFLKLMGASLLLAGLTGCGPTKSDEALPYVNQPDAADIGVPRFYATAVTFEGYAQPVIATTYAGRPTKLDGNPDHPVTGGKSDAFLQSAIFGLYDPERSKVPLHNGEAATWAAFATALHDLRTRWKERRGEGLHILTGAISSPTLIRQMGDFAKQFPAMRWSQFEPAGSARQDAAMALAFGQPTAPHYRLDRCDVIVSLDHDLVGAGPHQIANARGFASRRGEIAPGGGRLRLYAAESVPGLTGVVADARLPCDPFRIAMLAQAIGAEFGLDGFARPELTDREARWIKPALADLRAHAGHSLLVIGPHLDPGLQAIGPAINAKLNNAGATVWYSAPILQPGAPAPLTTLAHDLAAGAVDTLITIDCNPAYAAPGALNFRDLMAKAPHRIHAGLHADETAQACEWHVPIAHSLESWSDARAIDGTATILQPVIAPLYGSRTTHQLVDLLLGNDTTADAAVRATWQPIFGAEFDARWTRALHDGFVADTAAKPFSGTPKPPQPPPVDQADDYEIAFRPDPTVWDGRFANIAWLQELPKPLTKITWDNVVAISPALASEHKLANGDVVEVSVAGRNLRGPAWIVPGQAPRTIALYFGYGRRAGGSVAEWIGYDAFTVQPSEGATLARGTISLADGTHQIATTQAHHRIDGFDLVREVTAKNPRTAPPKEIHSFYPDWNEVAVAKGFNHAWGMVIDLDLCIGCNACVSACNVENNVLVVGKDQVARGREMLWLRVDRYYTGDIDNPNSFFQPVPCMHCEKAPCEMGCPVHATVHSPEGVNQMVFNRCIGTRTCSSYCPYKVRRFNWYDFRQFAAADQAAKNPDVSVRSRGVMEKCSYCTQRINAAHVEADKEGRDLRRDEVVTACQQACPTKAIVFGDLRDPQSEVAKRRSSGRHYALLEELGTRPRTTYLAGWNDKPEGEA